MLDFAECFEEENATETSLLKRDFISCELVEHNWKVIGFKKEADATTMENSMEVSQKN